LQFGTGGRRGQGSRSDGRRPHGLYPRRQGGYLPSPGGDGL